MKVRIIKHPTEADWLETKRRALVTVGIDKFNPPDETWKRKILCARHSPIRYLHFSFYIECPYWVSVHLSRHVHAQPYVRSQRNDRQSRYDRNKAPQDEIISMIWDMNAEELITIMNKRLCRQASVETRDVVRQMREQVLKTNPEFRSELVPMCIREGACHEIRPCRKDVKNDLQTM